MFFSMAFSGGRTAVLVFTLLAGQWLSVARAEDKAAPKAAVPMELKVQDDDFFPLPSPSEVLSESDRQGMKIVVSEKSLSVVGTDLEKLAKEKPAKAAFAMGRIFSIAGYKFKELSNTVLLQLAGKIYLGMDGLGLPPAIKTEVVGFYGKMLGNPKWERGELMLTFTAARSSLLFLLKDPAKVKPEERPAVSALGSCLEMGIWYQSVKLAMDSIQGEQNLRTFHELYLMDDVLEYFSASLSRMRGDFPDEVFYSRLADANKEMRLLSGQEKISANELGGLKSALEKVLE